MRNVNGARDSSCYARPSEMMDDVKGMNGSVLCRFANNDAIDSFCLLEIDPDTVSVGGALADGTYGAYAYSGRNPAVSTLHIGGIDDGARGCRGKRGNAVSGRERCVRDRCSWVVHGHACPAWASDFLRLISVDFRVTPIGSTASSCGARYPSDCPRWSTLLLSFLVGHFGTRNRLRARAGGRGGCACG